MNEPVNSPQWDANSVVLIGSKLARWHRNLLIRQCRFHRFVQDRNAKLLDLGCGSGPFLEYFTEAGFTNLSGIEPEARLIQNIPSHIHADVRQCMAEKINFADESFDVVWIYGVLHHLKGLAAYEAACQEIHRILKPGGVVFIIEPGQWTVFRLVEISAKILGKVSKTFRAFSECLDEETVEQHFFIKNHLRIRESLLRQGFKPVVNRYFVYSWMFAAHKAR